MNGWRELSARTIFLHQAIADRFGLNITDHKCLDLLVNQGPMPAGRLAELSGLTTGAITGVVDRLEKKGFVQRAADPRDRRKAVIVPVPEKVAEIGKIFGRLAERTAAVIARYSPKERAAIDDFAVRMSTLVEQFVEELKAGRLD
jgi:DNA-binding MarR family transcriptional regulator